MPEGSAREIIDREEKIEVRIKKAQLEVERYRSTLDILSNDLKMLKKSWLDVMQPSRKVLH